MPGPNLFEDPGWDVQGQCLTGWARMSGLQFCLRGTPCVYFATPASGKPLVSARWFDCDCR